MPSYARWFFEIVVCHKKVFLGRAPKGGQGGSTLLYADGDTLRERYAVDRNAVAPEKHEGRARAS
jgi:hypothetical protein